MPWLNTKQPEMIEKVLSALCYLSCGLIGLLYILLQGKSAHAPFFRFHFLQSILIGILGYVLSWTVGAFTSILMGMLGLLGESAHGASQWLAVSIAFVAHNVYLAGILLLGYGAIWALLGKYAEIPFISNIVRQQIR